MVNTKPPGIQVSSLGHSGDTLQLIYPGRPMRGHPSRGWGHPRSLRGLFVWLGSRLVTPALNSFQAETISAGLCGWISVVSIKHLSTFRGCQALPPQASLDLPAGTLVAHLVCRQGGFHLDGHTSWAARSCERMSAPPSVCLASKENESGFNQEQSNISQALVRGDNFRSSAVLLAPLPGSARG